MDNNLLEKTRQAVEKYHSKQAGDKVKATRSILSAVLDCRNFITEESQEGSPQLARELTEVLSVLPMFSNFASDKAALSNIDTKESATEHLQLIQQSLENSLKEMQVGKKKKIQDWVKSHPVLGKLKKTATKDLPQGAYVLLFRRSASLPQKRKNNNKRDRDKRQKSESGLNVQSKIAALTILEQAGEEKLDLLNAAEGTVCTSTESENSAELQITENKSSEHESPKTEDSGEKTCKSELIETNSNAEEDVASAAGLDSTDSTGATEQASSEDDGAESDDSQSNDDDDDNVDLVSEDEQEDVVSESENNGAEHSQSKSTETASDESTNPAQDNDAAGGAPTQNVKPSAEVIPPDLVVRPAPDGKVFTRFRPKEFSDDTRLYRMFRGGPPLVGACIIADGKLVSSIGVLPQAPEGRDQLRLLLTLSKDAVGKPGRDFVESNEVLAELHQVCKSRSLHKDAYILLFQIEQKQEDESSSSADLADKQSPSAETSGVLTPVNEAKELPADSANTETSQEADAESASLESADATATDAESSATESAEETGAAAISETSSTDNEVSEAKSEAQESDTQETSAPPKIELVSKTTEDGRIITRYRSFDFSDMRAIHENFRKRPAVIGAAIIRERELIKVLGTVPTIEGTKQLDVLLGASRQALEKPAIEFISSNQVLNSLYELSNGEYRQREYDVVLFTETEGRPEVLAMPDRRGYAQAKTPLAEFRIPKMLHDRFKSERAVVGASIICEQSSPAPSREVAGKGNKDKNKDRDRGSDNSFRTRSAPRSQVVLAAFGKTPLKQNVLLSPEILKRLGVDLSIL